MDLIQKVIHRHIAADLIGIGRHLGKLGHDLIALIVDLTDQLLQNVLHGDDAQSAAVIIHNHRDVHLFTLKFRKQTGDLHAAVDIHRLGHQLFKVKVFIHQGRLQNIAGMNYTDDMIHRFGVDRDAGKALFGDDLHHFLRGGFHIQRHHIDAGRQDILHGGIVKLQGRLDQFFFLLFQNTLLFDGVQHIHQFLLGDSGLLVTLLFFPEGLHQPQEQPAERRKCDHKHPQRPGEGHAELLGIGFGKAFGKDLPKGKYRKRGNACGNSNGIVAEVKRNSHRNQRGNGNIHQIVADQDGGDQFIVLLGHLYRLGGAFVAVLRHGAQPNHIGCGKGGLGS